ncbi:Flagellar motor protein MotB [Thauera humireducens]|uniref:OmpA family protein n=1 Tax=Thauera humireducens TaxID=1134435 RepID=UPI002467A5FD|nr:OmpA family protein [Thauera humireducens]CAH1747383.1 Flagellar motor protein MotB [Thauera humireducens]
MNLRPHLSLLAPVVAAVLMSACATPGTPDASAVLPAADDPIHRHALVREPAPTPDWTRLRQTLNEATRNAPGVTVGAGDAQGLKIEIPVADGFASGSTVIRPSLASALDTIAPSLASEAGVAIKVVGHTDSQGSEMVNLRLSIDRAEAVVAYLATRGVAPERLTADGRGEADPLTGNATEEGRARNRRVELLLRATP